MYLHFILAFTLIQVALSAQQKTLFPNDFGEPVPFKAEFHDRTFDYTMQQPLKEVCSNVKVLVLIPSGPENFEKRQAIRKSWMNDESNPDDYLTLFFIGHSADPKVNEAILKEQYEHGDIVRYSATEVYDMLPLKTHASFAWQRKFCPSAQYLFKTDDDSAVYLKRFDHFVRKDFDPKLDETPAAFFCNRYDDKKPHRNPQNKYYVSLQDYPQLLYPTFCQGSSYLVTRDGVSALLNHTHEVPFLRLEDVLFTGIVAQAANVDRHGAHAFGFKANSLRDDQDVPYLSVVVGLPASKIPRLYQLMKVRPMSKKLLHDYHFAQINF